MTFSNHINSEEDNEFIRQFPIPDDFDSEWVDPEDKLSCQDCEYYNDEAVILPCAVNPEQVYHADDCQDYSIRESNA